MKYTIKIIVIITIIMISNMITMQNLKIQKINDNGEYYEIVINNNSYIYEK